MVKWSGIQHALEEAESDILLLLDCCASGTANTDVGRGVTELIAACGFNASANPVGPHSFTGALITELGLLSLGPPFTIGTLYNKILRRSQNWIPYGREMQKPPLHVVLTQKNRLPQSIQLAIHPFTSFPTSASDSSHRNQGSNGIPGVWPSMHIESRSSTPQSTGESSQSIDNGSLRPTLGASSRSSWVGSQVNYPAIALTVRLKDTMVASQLSEDIFADWLRMMPVNAEQVKVEAGFASFSTLLMVSLPVEIWCYLDPHPAITLAGFTRSPNLIKQLRPKTPQFNQPATCVDVAWHTIRYCETPAM